MVKRVEGKNIVVTAAGKGIGRASALMLAAEGAHVWATDIDESALAELARDAGEGSTLRTARLDVLDSADVDAFAATTGPLDALFNCAGYVHDGNILKCTDKDWDFSFDLNVKGAYRVTRALLPAMLDKLARTGGTAAILNMASMASSVKGFPNRFAYGATKAAVIGMTKALAADYVTRGLRCNALCPGTVDTPSLRGRIAAAADPVAAEKAFIARHPMGRLATVDDITPQVVYLLSDESRFVSGQAVLVDGGVTI